jgi:hypothetical protein
MQASKRFSYKTIAPYSKSRSIAAKKGDHDATGNKGRRGAGRSIISRLRLSINWGGFAASSIPESGGTAGSFPVKSRFTGTSLLGLSAGLRIIQVLRIPFPAAQNGGPNTLRTSDVSCKSFNRRRS